MVALTHEKGLRHHKYFDVLGREVFLVGAGGSLGLLGLRNHLGKYGSIRGVQHQNVWRTKVFDDPYANFPCLFYL
jgi:hypothetical protein